MSKTHTNNPQTPSHSARHVASKKHPWRTVVIVLAVLLLLLVVLPGTVIMLFMRSLDSEISMPEEEREQVAEVLTPVEGSDKPFYALIIGSDNRGNEVYGRSDSMMLARIDTENKQVDLVSIPRDMQVSINGGSTPQKINAAYAMGGSSLMISTVSDFAGVPISHYIKVGFDGLEQLVDRLGGITVNVPESFSGGNGGVSLQAGEQTLNGEQALGFARERYQVQGGDFSRAQAQRIVLTAILKKMLEQPATEIPGLVQEFAAMISTDMSTMDLVDLGMQFYGHGVTINTAGCPSYAFSQDGVSYVGVEYAEWQDMMRRVDAGMGPKGEGEIPAEQMENAQLGAASNALSPRDYAGLINQSLNSDDVIGNE